MSRRLVAAAAIALGAWIGVSAAAPKTSGALRILTYNIHHGEGTDGILDLSRVAAVVMREQPDLVALQEVDQGTERSGRVNQAAELGILTSMHVVFGKAMDYQGGQYGLAVLSRWPFLRTENQPLPHAENYEPRTVLTVEVDPAGNGQRVVFSTTHLDQGRDATNRLLQAGYINELLAHDDRVPHVLAGDMNSRVDTDVMQALRTLWSDMFVEPPPADPLERPRYRVDYVLARPGWRWKAVEARAIEAPGVSDHRPVLAVLELSGIS